MNNEKKFLDQSGVEYLWSKIDMQDYPNNETLIAVINAIDENKADKNYVDIRVPAWTDADEGKILQIVNGTPTWISLS